MKPLVIIIVFISYGYFSDGQGREKRKSNQSTYQGSNDFASSSSSSSSSSLLSRKKMRDEGNNTGIIHETTKRILQYALDVKTNLFITKTSPIMKKSLKYASDVQPNSFSSETSSIIEQMNDLNLASGQKMPSEDEINILKRFKKTNLCIKYNGYLFIKLRSSKEKYTTINQILRKYTYFVMQPSEIIHVNDPKFLQFFKAFVKYLYHAVDAFLQNTDIADFIDEINSLLLDLILDCDVSISYFAKFHQTYKVDITYLIDLHSKTMNNFSNSPAETELLTGGTKMAILLNIWMALKNEDLKGSINCVKTRLLVFLHFLNNITSNELFNEVEEFIYKFSQLTVFSPERKLVTTTFPDKYRESWEYLNEYTFHIIEHFIRYLENRPEIQDMKMKNFSDIIIYLEHSLLHCGVPRKFLYDDEKETKYSILKFLKEKFLSDDEQQRENINFFEKYIPGTVDCFKNSIYNLFNQLFEVNNKACSAEYYNFLVEMTSVSSNCVANPDNETFFEYITNFEKVAVEALLDFDNCLFSANENINYMKFYVANIFTQFRNFYQSCGASSEMMKVRWNEFKES